MGFPEAVSAPPLLGDGGTGSPDPLQSSYRLRLQIQTEAEPKSPQLSTGEPRGAWVQAVRWAGQQAEA